ncbi:MAG: hypothetical protein ACJASZ_001433 [Yoonia sp.]|jgi:hypothetical protein
MPLAAFRKIGWFTAIWLLSVAALGIVAYAIRLILYG